MPAVTRIGDADITHCTQGFRLEGADGSISTAPKVFTNQTGESVSSLGGKGGQGAEFAITQTGTTYSAGIPTKPGLGYRIGDKIETPCGATVTVAEIFPVEFVTVVSLTEASFLKVRKPLPGVFIILSITVCETGFVVLL